MDAAVIPPVSSTPKSTCTVDCGGIYEEEGVGVGVGLPLSEDEGEAERVGVAPCVTEAVWLPEEVGVRDGLRLWLSDWLAVVF